MAQSTNVYHGLIIVCILSMFFGGALAIPCPSDMTGLDMCDCTWSASGHIINDVICNDLGHTNHYPLRSLARVPHITKLVYTGNNIVELESNIFGDCSQIRFLELTTIDFSNNGIQIIHGQSFHCVPNVKVLLLNNNQWNVDPNRIRVFSSMTKLEHLGLRNAFKIIDGTAANTIHLQTVFNGSHMIALKKLHLQGNDIQLIARKTFCQLPNLEELNLSDNKLVNIALDCLNNLQELYFSNNSIASLDEDELNSLEDMQKLQKVHLGSNPYQCNDCSDRTAYFRDWLNSRHRIVVEKNTVLCSNSDLIGERIADLTDKELKGTCIQPKSYKKKQTKEIITGVVLGIIAILTIVFIYINRKSIKKSTNKWIEPIRNSSIMKRMHFGYRNMHNDATGMFDSMQNEDDATFATMSNEDAATYASMDNKDAANYANMPRDDDMEPVVT